MRSRTVNIIDALYGEELRGSGSGRLVRWLLPKRSPRRRKVIGKEEQILALYKERDRILTTGRLLVAAGLALTAVVGVVSLIYFNRLTSYQQDVSAEQAKIACLLDRR